MRNYQIGIVLFCMMLNLPGFAQELSVNGLRTEYRKNPMGIDAPEPRLSWKITSSRRNVMQSAYQVRVGTDSVGLSAGRAVVWDTGNQKSDASVFVRYGGSLLKSGTRYYWQVKVKDNQGNSSAWSAVNSWHTGLRSAAEWSAQWISTAPADTVVGPSPIFRKVFSTEGKVKSAVLYITAHGLYEAQLNGKRIGNDHLAPGWTSYHKRLLYQSYEVTSLLKKGQNAIGFSLGDGWYRGYLAFDRRRDFYGKRLSALVQLVIEYTNGTKKTIDSDGSWKYSTGPILFSDLYNGEIYDARLEKGDWASPDYNDADWKKAGTLQADKEVLESSISPLAQKQEQFNVLKIIKTPKGETVLDFGQNLVGWVSFKLTAKKGSYIQLEHGEVLDKAGNFYDANLRHAKQHVKYIFKGNGLESYEPHFTYQGFRYVKVTGDLTQIDPSSFKAIAVYSDMDPTGTFNTSNPLLNQLQHNIQWGQKGNFMDVPTDCPQRDERLG